MIAGITNYEAFPLLGLDILRYSRNQNASATSMTALISHSQRLMIPQRTAAPPPLDREVCHINLMLIWPSCDHVPSALSEATPEAEECGPGESCFPIHATEVPPPGRSKAHLQRLASHQLTSLLSEHSWKEDDFT